MSEADAPLRKSYSAFDHLSPATREYLSRKVPLFIGGEEVSPEARGELACEDPASGECVGTAIAGTVADIDAAVAAARHAFDHGPWPHMAAAARRGVMLAIADRLEADRDRLAEIEVVDNGMPLAAARGMVGGAAELFRYYAGWVGKLYGKAITVESWDPGVEVSAYTRREPIGVVGLILPWNFPLAIAAMKLAPALAAGCTAVIKPAEQTPLSAMLLATIARDAGLPAGVLNVVNGRGEEAGAALAAHRGVDKISFTGSTEVGRLIVAAAAGNLKKVSLELGGKAPFVVLPDADLHRVVPALVRAAYANRGQDCTAATRVLAHDDIADALQAQLTALIPTMTAGPGFEDGHQLGPLISAEHRDKVMGYVAGARTAGATIMAGGEQAAGGGWFMQPTLITDVDPTMAIMREEVFGPVTCIQRVGTRDPDALAALANDCDFGLVASVWTQDLGMAHCLVRTIRAGTVTVNSHGHPGITMPFGGYKQSGWGREFGRDAIDGYLETKSVAFTV